MQYICFVSCVDSIGTSQFMYFLSVLRHELWSFKNVRFCPENDFPMYININCQLSFALYQIWRKGRGASKELKKRRKEETEGRKEDPPVWHDTLSAEFPLCNYLESVRECVATELNIYTMTNIYSVEDLSEHSLKFTAWSFFGLMTNINGAKMRHIPPNIYFVNIWRNTDKYLECINQKDRTGFWQGESMTACRRVCRVEPNMDNFTV